MSPHGEDRQHTSPSAAAVAASVRRTLSLNTGTPTRTVRLTTLEEQSNSRDPTPSAIAEQVILRASSSSRRSPRRFESPLENAPIRDDRISIRNTIGALARNREEADEDRRSNTAPNGQVVAHHSHRKLRRWNNDRLVDLDISSAKTRQIFAAAKKDAHLYKAVVNPLEDNKMRNETYKRFMTDDAMESTRHAFFEGIGPVPQRVAENRRRHEGPSLARLDHKLRRLVQRAHHNSCAATQVLTVLEEFVVAQFYPFDNGAAAMAKGWWNELLVEYPQISKEKKGEEEVLKVQVKFSASSSSGGFHRLLLSAIGQFHGIKAYGKNRSDGKVLVLQGRVNRDGTCPVRLLSLLEQHEAASTDNARDRTRSSPGSISVSDDYSIVDATESSVTTYVLVSEDEAF